MARQPSEMLSNLPPALSEAELMDLDPDDRAALLAAQDEDAALAAAAAEEDDDDLPDLVDEPVTDDTEGANDDPNEEEGNPDNDDTDGADPDPDQEGGDANADPDPKDTPAAAQEETPPAAQTPPPPAGPSDEDVQAARTAHSDMLAARRQLIEKFEDGDVDRDEFEKQDAALIEKLQDARYTLRQYDEARNAANEAWYKAADTYLAANKELQTPAVTAQFDRILSEVDRTMRDLPDADKFTIAHRNLANLLQGTSMEIAGPTGTKATEPPKTNRRRPDPPATLAGLQSGGAIEDNPKRARIEGALRKGNAEDAEDALGTMTEAERKKWLLGG